MMAQHWEAFDIRIEASVRVTKEMACSRAWSLGRNYTHHTSRARRCTQIPEIVFSHVGSTTPYRTPTRGQYTSQLNLHLDFPTTS